MERNDVAVLVEKFTVLRDQCGGDGGQRFGKAAVVNVPIERDYAEKGEKN